MADLKTIVLASMALLPVSGPASAQQLENSKTPATSGTVDTQSQGHSNGANLGGGGKGPASETRMPTQPPKTDGRVNGAAQAGASDRTKELFQH